MASEGGVLVTQGYDPEYGNMLEIDHGNGWATRLAHASAVFVKKGDLVKRGQQIAAMGTTGRSTGARLHFEVLVQNIAQDPQKFLDACSSLATRQVATAAPPAERARLGARAEKRRATQR